MLRQTDRQVRHRLRPYFLARKGDVYKYLGKHIFLSLPCVLHRAVFNEFSPRAFFSLSVLCIPSPPGHHQKLYFSANSSAPPHRDVINDSQINHSSHRGCEVGGLRETRRWNSRTTTIPPARTKTVTLFLQHKMLVTWTKLQRDNKSHSTRRQR